jgi:bifunctional non-homologous end joining protein LigD
MSTMAHTRVLEIDDRELLLNRLDDVLWPDAGITKADLIEYYFDVADRLLPFVANRPVSLLRMPDAMTGECVYQRMRIP